MQPGPLPWPVPGVQIYCGDSAQRSKQKKNEGWGRFRYLLSPSPCFPPYFFLALAALHYPNAWNRPVSWGHFWLITQGKLKKNPFPRRPKLGQSLQTCCVNFFCRLSRKINILESTFFTKQELITLGGSYYLVWEFENSTPCKTSFRRLRDFWEILF